MERPIIFSTEMVRAILDGKKTMTRRIMRPQPRKSEALDLWRYKFAGWSSNHGPVITPAHSLYYACPYGKIGDILWVRETFQRISEDAPFTPGYFYKSDGPERWYGWHIGRKWIPSIHMPKKACRIKLRITGVRVERLKDITIEDSFNEGIDWKIKFPDEEPNLKFYRDYNFKDRYARGTNFGPRESFFSLWNSIHGNRAHNQNPWVWVIEFEKLT